MYQWPNGQPGQPGPAYQPYQGYTPYQPPAPSPIGPDGRPTLPYLQKNARKLYNTVGLGLILQTAIMFTISLLFSMGLLLFSHTQLYSWLYQNYQGLTMALSMVAALVGNLTAYFFIKRFAGLKSRQVFDFSRLRFSHVLFGFIACLGVNGVFSFLVDLLGQGLRSLGLNPTTPDFSLGVGLAADVITVLYVVIVAPITEELVFRGAVQTSLRRYGHWFSIIVTALLFSLMHGNLYQAIPTFFMALVMGYVADRSGTVLPTILIHMLNNGFALFQTAGLVSDRVMYIIMGAVMIAGVLIVLLSKFYKKVPAPDPAIHPSLRWQSLCSSWSFWVTIAVYLLLIFFVYM